MAWKLKKLRRYTGKIIHVNVDSYTGLKSFHVQKILKELGLSKNQQKDLSNLLNLCLGFLQLDAAMIEINPLVITKTDDLLAIDAKMSFDDNALRQPEVNNYAMKVRKTHRN